MAPNTEALNVQHQGDAASNDTQNQVARAESNNNALTFNDAFGQTAAGAEAFSYKDKIDGFIKPHWEITEEDRKQAKETLASQLSELIPEADRKNLQKAQEALVDGDAKKLAEALAPYAKDKEMLAKIVKELNRNLDREGAGINLVMNGAGNVVLYGKGDTALEMNPNDGSVQVRSIRHNNDGSIALLPGEVIGTDPSKVARQLADQATRGITGGYIAIRPMGMSSYSIDKTTVGKPVGRAADSAASNALEETLRPN